jgi:peptide/nickel transport system substrate-binding protein
MLVSKNNWMKLLALVVIGSLMLSACGQQAAPTAQTVATQVATEAPGGQATPMETQQVATTAPQPTTPSASGGTVTVGIPSGFDVLDPNVTTFTTVARMTLHMTDPLIWQTKPGVFIPGLATEWSINADATEYTFKLRNDVTFHDGTPFNAEAVKFTFDRIVNPDTKSQVALALIGPYSATQIVNDYEVIVKFSSPYAPFLDSVSQPYLAPVSPTAYQQAGADAWGMTAFVGTGPFKFESMVLNDNIVMVRNPDYNWGPAELGMNGPAKLDKIVYKFIEEPATRTAALLTGDINFLDTVLQVDFNTLKDNPDVVAEQIPQAGMGDALMFNHQKAPTDELAVRRAMQLAMDKQGMIDTVFNGFGTPACALITPEVFGYCPETCDMYPYNLDAAKKVLDDAGWVDTNGDGVREKNGQPLVIAHYYRADDAPSVDMAAFMKTDFAQVGIDVELNGLSRTGYFDAVRTGQHNTQGWLEWGSDPDFLLREVLYSANAGGGTNRNNLIDPEMDKLIDEAAAEPDQAKRADLTCQILKRVKDNADMEIWDNPVLLYAHAASLKGIVYYLAGSFPYFGAASIGQ